MGHLPEDEAENDDWFQFNSPEAKIDRWAKTAVAMLQIAALIGGAVLAVWGARQIHTGLAWLLAGLLMMLMCRDKPR